MTMEDEREKIRFFWALRSIDEFLNDFEFSLDKKTDLLRIMKTNFHTEFNSDKKLKRQLTDKYRENRKTIEFNLDRARDNQNEFNPLFDILNEKSRKIRPIIKEILHRDNESDQKEILNLIISHIHMMCNRIVLFNHRKYELLFYDMLYQYYFSLGLMKGRGFLFEPGF